MLAKEYNFLYSWVVNTDTDHEGVFPMGTHKPWSEAQFNARGHILVVPQAHHDLDKRTLAQYIVDLEARDPWVHIKSSLPSMPDRPTVTFVNNTGRFGPEYTIHFNPGTLLLGRQVPAYQQHVMKPGKGLRDLGIPEIYRVWPWAEFIGLMEELH